MVLDVLLNSDYFLELVLFFPAPSDHLVVGSEFDPVKVVIALFFWLLLNAPGSFSVSHAAHRMADGRKRASPPRQRCREYNPPGGGLTHGPVWQVNLGGL